MARLLMIGVFALLVAAGARPSAADIYIWTDAAGTKHITNYSPPPQAELLMRTPEVPYDEEADQRRRETERREQLLRERQALLEKEAELARRELEAARRIAEAESRAADALERSAQLLDEAREDRYDDSTRYGFYYYPGYSYKRHPHYYRRDGNIYYHRPKHFPRRSWNREPPARVREKQAGQLEDRPAELHPSPSRRAPVGGVPSTGRQPGARPDLRSNRF